ncbi:Uncharacterised protein [Mycobacteroides abscessus subsp. abscessus]|nr:Uncharacterised protein [Mycobacteroides abscessus subsp. abscessus]
MSASDDPDFLSCEIWASDIGGSMLRLAALIASARGGILSATCRMLMMPLSEARKYSDMLACRDFAAAPRQSSTSMPCTLPPSVCMMSPSCSAMLLIDSCAACGLPVWKAWAAL